MRKKTQIFNKMLFSHQDGVFGILSSAQDDCLLVSNILQLSADGIQVAFKRQNADGLSEGDVLNLDKITGTRNLSFCKNIKLEIKSILDVDVFEHISAECKFRNIPELARKKINQFVNSERLFLGPNPSIPLNESVAA